MWRERDSRAVGFAGAFVRCTGPVSFVRGVAAPRCSFALVLRMACTGNHFHWPRPHHRLWANQRPPHCPGTPADSTCFVWRTQGPPTNACVVGNSLFCIYFIFLFLLIQCGGRAGTHCRKKRRDSDTESSERILATRVFGRSTADQWAATIEADWEFMVATVVPYSPLSPAYPPISSHHPHSVLLTLPPIPPSLSPNAPSSSSRWSRWGMRWSCVVARCLIVCC